MVGIRAPTVIKLNCYQKVTVSMIGGAMRANVDELTAPTKEMNRSRRGMAAPSATGRKDKCYSSETC